jgi:hypothetical protein
MCFLGFWLTRFVRSSAWECKRSRHAGLDRKVAENAHDAVEKHKVVAQEWEERLQGSVVELAGTVVSGKLVFLLCGSNRELQLAGLGQRASRSVGRLAPLREAMAPRHGIGCGEVLRVGDRVQNAVVVVVGLRTR